MQRIIAKPEGKKAGRQKAESEASAFCLLPFAFCLSFRT
jgi:hypothetical protein